MKELKPSRQPSKKIGIMRKISKSLSAFTNNLGLNKKETPLPDEDAARQELLSVLADMDFGSLVDELEPKHRWVGKAAAKVIKTLLKSNKLELFYNFAAINDYSSVKEAVRTMNDLRFIRPSAYTLDMSYKMIRKGARSDASPKEGIEALKEVEKLSVYPENDIKSFVTLCSVCDEMGARDDTCQQKSDQIKIKALKQLSKTSPVFGIAAAGHLIKTNTLDKNIINGVYDTLLQASNSSHEMGEKAPFIMAMILNTCVSSSANDPETLKKAREICAKIPDGNEATNKMLSNIRKTLNKNNQNQLPRTPQRRRA